MRKKLSVYSTHTETRSFRLWDSDLRRILNLPKRTGKFTAVTLSQSGDLLQLTFVRDTNKRIFI